jgi:ABC-type transport system involved in multi-copper enzyme maturation permease subunit
MLIIIFKITAIILLIIIGIPLIILLLFLLLLFLIIMQVLPLLLLASTIASSPLTCALTMCMGYPTSTSILFQPRVMVRTRSLPIFLLACPTLQGSMIDQYFELSSTVEFDDNNNYSTYNKSNDGVIAAAAASVGASCHDSEEANQSYLQQWTTKIIDNIEITVSNLHFQYEDFGIATCKELWDPLVDYVQFGNCMRR